jgi:hypothetical protein
MTVRFAPMTGHCRPDRAGPKVPEADQRGDTHVLD